MTERDIFIAALQQQDPARRQAYLDEVCTGQPELRRQVEHLLRLHEGAGSFLEKPAAASQATGPVQHATEPASSGEAPGAVIGPYKLLEPIGEGGMGTVWMAQQTEPVKRLVAVKLIKTGMDSRQVIARFEAERQALALMDHVNIARVLDAGTTDPGRPYFVMDLVKGVPITRYCDEHRLTPRQRLELFVPVCQAVQHAHQKGIIHRDLKPSNVLVALYDGKPVPKVIDFGVAKAAGQVLTEKTLVTGFGAIVGTLEYMSPEQAEINQLDIDTRSDIYALGVLLYELLTGSPPFTREDKAGVLEMLRLIREQEPTKPSAKLSTAEGLPTLAANRGTEPAKLTKLVRGELDWIVMKALEKDRSRRYATAVGFALDVQRYLADEPVLACPPSAGYRLRKFVRRNRGPVLAAVLVLLALVGGIIGTTWGLVRAEQARQAETERAEGERLANLAAQDAGKKAVERAEGERKATEQALKRLAQIKKSHAILAWIFDDLDIRRIKDGARPLEAELAQRLVMAAAQLEGEAVGDPLLVADLQNRLGGTLLYLGYAQEAVGLFARAWNTRKLLLGADHLDTLVSMSNLALCYKTVGKLGLALPLYEETLKLTKAKLGADHPHTLLCMHNLAGGYHGMGKVDLALPLLENTLQLKKANLGADHPDTLMTMNSLAEGYRAAGKLDLALPLLEQTLLLRKAKLGANHPDTLMSMSNLAEGYRATGKLDLALPLLEKTLKLRKEKLGADHPDTLASMANLAWGYRAAGKLDLALRLHEDTLKLRTAKLGYDHPDTLTSVSNLAVCYRAAGKVGLALQLDEETLKLRKAKLGNDHPDTFTSMNNLALDYLAAGKLELALPLLEDALQLTKSKLGNDHPHTLTTMNNLAAAYHAAGKLELALQLLEDALQLTKAKLGADHPHTLTSMNNLAALYQAAGKLALALPLLQEAAAAVEMRHFQQENADWIVNNLIDCHEQLRQFDQAEPWRRKWLAVVQERSGADSVAAADVLVALGWNLLQQKKWTGAEAVLRECLAIRQKKQPDAWTTFHAQTMLGGALLGQKKFPAAEPLLLQGYEGMKQRATTIPPQDKFTLTAAAQRLVRLYDATGKTDDAAKWRAILEQHEGTLVGPVHDIGDGLKLHGKLDAQSPTLVYQVKFSAGKTYVIDMISPDQKALDPFLVLKDADGQQVAEDDDSGGGLNARIIYRALRDGVYRIHATSFNAGSGAFTLTVREKK
jgi:serine/threonine protein kinase